ncbi:MAG TPA: hypothetical protein VL382_06440 [Terriglobales bacterium]|nr:hypothetical protein [Terriglobales bacterium]
MTARRSITFAFAVLLVVCLLGQAATVHRLDQMRPEKTLEEVLYVPSAKVLQRLSLGYNGLLADIYWTRAVQYFGTRLSSRTKSTRYDLLYPLLDITTDLDRNLIPAYEFGASFLTQTPPLGAGQADNAVKLLKKGVAANPEQWRLYFDLGFVYYLNLKDYAAAADAFRQAGSMPGGNPNVLPMAAASAQLGGDPRVARALWQLTYDQASQDLVRKNAQAHVRSMDLDDAVPYLESKVAQFRAQHGRNPAGWMEMARAGVLPGVPKDPAGDFYRLTADGHVLVQHPDKFPFATRGIPDTE